MSADSEPLSWQPIRVLDEHHLFPKETNRDVFTRGDPASVLAEQIPTDETCVEIIANRCLLLKSTNIRVGTRTPDVVENTPDINTDWCQTYLFDWAARSTWREFIDARSQAIDKRLHEVLSDVGHMWPDAGEETDE